MVRGLFSSWKQPIFVDFDTNMSKPILIEIIDKLFDAGFTVRAVVSDCGGSNQGLWKALNVGINRNYFLHPRNGKNIYVFGDAPHLLKLTRNWLLDKGFQTTEGLILTKKPLEQLYRYFKYSKKELTTCHLTEKHLTCKDSERQNVRLAAQLLSRTTSALLKRYFPESEEAQKLSELILLLNKWFDIFNTYTVNGTGLKIPYGKNLDEQNEVLKLVEDFFYTMRPIGNTGITVFQKAIVMSVCIF